MNNQIRFTSLLVLICGCSNIASAADEDLRTRVAAATYRAAGFYRNQVASHGGYVYFYSLDLKVRWGEGLATADQIWVQPPGTPTVGMAYLKAYEATGKQFYLDAATKADVITQSWRPRESLVYWPAGFAIILLVLVYGLLLLSRWRRSATA